MRSQSTKRQWIFTSTSTLTRACACSSTQVLRPSVRQGSLEGRPQQRVHRRQGRNGRRGRRGREQQRRRRRRGSGRTAVVVRLPACRLLLLSYRSVLVLGGPGQTCWGGGLLWLCGAAVHGVGGAQFTLPVQGPTGSTPRTTLRLVGRPPHQRRAAVLGGTDASAPSRGPDMRRSAAAPPELRNAGSLSGNRARPELRDEV
jgi:hypothetical protein